MRFNRIEKLASGVNLYFNDELVGFVPRHEVKKPVKAVKIEVVKLETDEKRVEVKPGQSFNEMMNIA